MADVDGGGARRYNGTRKRWARAAGLWAATSTAAVLGDVGLARWGEQGTAAAPGADETTKCLGRAKEEGNIWGGLLSRVVASPGTKGVFGRAGKIPSPRPTFSPGWIYHPEQKGPVFPRSRLILCLFLFLFTSLLKLVFIC